uniref:Ig-like domain-containing protein n=1 Tax=Canis lupus familiaris TaxID=9615 RepID=A0A8C0M4M3_CANLF
FTSGLVAFSLEQPSVVVVRMDTLAIMPCKASTKISHIHWYHHQEHTAPQRILRLEVSGSSVNKDSVLKADKIIAIKDKDVTSYSLLVLKLKKNDEAVYYCATWEVRYNKVFGPGTVLRVTDKNPDEDIPPKPTVFLPSITEIKDHNTGTYLCLLEDFFPDVIKIDWKEKDDKTVLQSQQGDTMKTKDTYMKFSWLTVTQESMAKDHKCMVKHERNKGRVDQEIDFPSINRSMCTKIARYQKLVLCPNKLTWLDWIGIRLEIPDKNWKPQNNTRQECGLQLMNTSAYYIYILLLFKSLMYSIIITICLLERPALDGNRKN